jgi:hypothetical protein
MATHLFNSPKHAVAALKSRGLIKNWYTRGNQNAAPLSGAWLVLTRQVADTFERDAAEYILSNPNQCPGLTLDKQMRYEINHPIRN